jgi:hypothetical protein
MQINPSMWTFKYCAQYYTVVVSSIVHAFNYCTEMFKPS